MKASNEYKLAVAVCALCRHDRHGFCLVRNRDVLKLGKLNKVDCSYLREIVAIANEGKKKEG